uniref:F-box protein At2g26160-like n=1 Tax=Fragaria vesca subsp. vesca TaxID=101020 RepID=UPI0005CB6E35|nr:PREDICTED: F-box protein At2g26160-like [Fragaria vesca subsp. vesca]
MDPSRDWSQLPKNLLNSVLGRLELLGDYLRFSIVCKPWYWVAKDNKNIFATRQSCHPPPMLLINTDNEDTWKVYNVMDNKLLDMEVRLPNTRFCGSSKGWLIYVEKNNYAITLVNPFFRVRGRREKQNSLIHLPPLLPPINDFYRQHFDYLVHKVVISADPLLNANECIVVVITEPFSQLAFIRLGKDSTWTFVDWRHRARGFCEVVFLEGKLYGVQCDNRVLSCEINSRFHSGLKIVARSFLINWTKNYLVYLNEKGLLLVHRLIVKDEDGRPRTVKFVIYKLNFNKRKWIEINTLGDVALFVGDNSSFSVTASSFRGCLPNSVYFSHDSNSQEEVLGADGPHDFGVYDFENKRFLTIDAVHVSTLAKLSKQPPIWIVPTFQL